jgi:transposase
LTSSLLTHFKFNQLKPAFIAFSFIALYINNGIRKKYILFSCHAVASDLCLADCFTMVNRRISDDLKMAALRLKAKGHSVTEILDITRFSRNTFHRAQRRYNQVGTVAKAQAIGRGRLRKAVRGDIQYLIRLAHHKPVMFLDEYQRQVDENRFLSLSMTTIHRELIRAGLSVKHVQKMAAERDSMKRADFRRRISQYPTTSLLILDEVSKDNRTYSRLWGRAERGARVEVHQAFVRKRRFSMLAAMELDKGIIAAQVVEGSFTRDLFLRYLRDDLVCTSSISHSPFLIATTHTTGIKLPLMTPYPGPRSVLVMDNARIHHHEDITDLVESYGSVFDASPLEDH